MFFKKKREAAKAQQEEVRNAVLGSFDAKLEEALKTRDPAERILALEEHKKAVDTFLDAANGNLVSEAKKKWMLGYIGGTLGSNLAMDAVSIMLIGVPTSVLFIIPSIIIGSFAGAKRSEKALAKLVEQNADFFAAIRGKKDDAEKALDKILETDMRDLAESPKFQQALQAVPKLRDKFADAYKKHVIEGGLSKDEPKKKPPGFNV